MKKSLLLFNLTFLAGYIFCQSVSPQVVATTGDYYESANATISWTIGETVIETLSEGNIILTQGFQQTRYTITAIEEVAGMDIEISVYPNPASDFIFVETESFKVSETWKDWENIKIELIDIHGKVLMNETMNSTRKQINLKQFAENLYFLKVRSENGKLLKTFKIQKLN